MRIIARTKLIAFGKEHPDAKSQLDAWWAEAKRAKWESPQDIKDKYGNASIVANNRVVFNVCGNKYRLIVSFKYKSGIGFVRFLGTHEEYDKINAEEF